MGKNCPCYDTKNKRDCPKRYVGCHAKCPEYIDWVKQQQADKDAKETSRIVNNQIISAHERRRAKYLKNKLKGH